MLTHTPGLIISNIGHTHTWLDDFSSRVFDEEVSPVKMCESELEAAQRLHQADSPTHVQVIKVPAELLHTQNSL